MFFQGIDRRANSQILISRPQEPLRRGMLQTFLAVGALVLAESQSPNLRVAQAKSIDEAEQLGMELIERFDLNGITTFYGAVSRYPSRSNFEAMIRLAMVQPDYPKVWDLSRLNLLKITLENLPPHFYAPNPKHDNTTIYLGPAPHSRCCNNDHYSNVVELGYRWFDSSIPRVGYRVAAHEFTHAVTFPLDQFIERGGQINEDGGINLHNSLKLIADDLLEDDFDKVNEKIIKVVGLDDYTFYVNHINEAREKGIPTARLGLEPKASEKLDFLHNLFYGLVSPEEFFATLASEYVEGKNYFEERYGRVYSPRVVDNLYDHTKRQIFREVEDRHGLPDFSLLKAA